TPGAATLMNSVNDSNPNDPNRPFEANIGDRLTDADVSWKWYSGGWDAAVSLQRAYQSGDPNQIAAAKAPFNDATNPLNLFQWHHQPFAYFDNYSPLSAGGQAHLQDENNFFSDLSSGNLPAVSFIKPLGPDNEHPGYASLLQGQQHVADIVQAVQNSSEWAHTAIIITYDENGGRWDHVAPPHANGVWGDGTRVPAIVISPYAKRHYVDHTQHDTLSILKTIEDRFGVQPLNTYDAAATSLSSSFGPYLAVGAGDASSTDAILWTRIQNPTGTAGVGLIAQVSTDPTFATGLAGFAGVTDPAHDYTVHIDATGLQPGTRYYYRFVADDGVISEVGTFVTAPDPSANVPVTFAFTAHPDA